MELGVRVVALCVEVGMVALLEKLLSESGPTRGAVLLRFRQWFENLGTVGGSAASMVESRISIVSRGISGTGGWAVNDRFPPTTTRRGLLLVTLIVSRIGFRLTGGGLADSSWGVGGIDLSSLALTAEWLRKDKAVSHMKWRSGLIAVNFNAR